MPWVEKNRKVNNRGGVGGGGGGAIIRGSRGKTISRSNKTTQGQHYFVIHNSEQPI